MASAHLVPKLAHNLWDRYTSRIDGMGADEGRKRLPRSYEVGASCFTGAATMMLTNPLDCLKQRWQVAPMQSQRSLGAFTREILLSEGIFTGLWFPGLTTNVMACSISVGVRLGFYPMLRDALQPDQQRSGFSMFTSGLLGGALAYIISSPFFAASRVAQAEVGTPQQASGSIGTLARMARTTGVLGLWRGSEILVARGALLSATQLATYDLCKGWLRSLGLEDGPTLHSVCAFATSLSVATAICPLDITYTAHLAGKHSHASAWSCALALLRDNGPGIFLRGWTPLWARFVPSGLLTFHIYEQSRRLLGGRYLE